MAQSNSFASPPVTFPNASMGPGGILDVGGTYTYTVTPVAGSEYDLSWLQKRLEVIAAVLETNPVFQRRRAWHELVLGWGCTWCSLGPSQELGILWRCALCNQAFHYSCQTPHHLSFEAIEYRPFRKGLCLKDYLLLAERSGVRYLQDPMGDFDITQMEVQLKLGALTVGGRGDV